MNVGLFFLSPFWNIFFLIKIISNTSLQRKSSDSCSHPNKTLWTTSLLLNNVLIVRLKCQSCTVLWFIILIFFWVQQQLTNNIDHTLKQTLLCVTWWMWNIFLREVKYSPKCLAWWFLIDQPFLEMVTIVEEMQAFL